MSNLRACPTCANAVVTSCTLCGGRGLVTTDVLSRLALELYNRSDTSRAIESAKLNGQANQASRTLRTIAIIQSLATITIAIAVSVGHPELNIALLSAAGITALFWLLQAWSLKSPMVPAIAGLAIYVTLWWGEAAMRWAALAQKYGEDQAIRRDPPGLATLFRWGITIALTRAVIAGVKSRQRARAQQQATASTQPPADPIDRLLDSPIPTGNQLTPNEIAPLLAPPTTERRLAGVLTSILLYVGLLYCSINIIALRGTGEMNPHVFLQMVAVSCTLIGMWSIACWRDTYRPLAKPIHPAWYGIAIGGGVVTFLIACGSLAIIRHLCNIPAPLSEAALFPEYDWLTVMLVVAVQPAIFEEIAFRGVIYGGFTRCMRAHENIILTALMFMVLHLSVPAFPHLLVMGLFLGWMRYRTGSFLPGVFAHFVHNMLCIVLT